MRLKDPFSLRAADMTKRTNRPRKPRDEESSDEVSGMVSQEVLNVIFMSLGVVTLMYYEPWVNYCECIFLHVDGFHTTSMSG